MAAVVAMRIALGFLVALCIRKRSFVSCNSCCYSIYPHEATGVEESFIVSSIWEYKQAYGLRLRPKHGLKILLILAGDVELCPGPAIKCSSCLKVIRKNQVQLKCDTCKKTYHSKCIMDKLDGMTESYLCKPCENESRLNSINGNPNDSDHDCLINARLKHDLKIRGLKIFHQNVNGLLSKIDLI